MNENKRDSDDYWLGVRDTLRMIDSFVKWSKRNTRRAKSLEEFITDGLIAAAQRCETCLSHELGLTFTEDEESTIDVLDEEPKSDEVPIEFDAPLTEPVFEDTPLSDAMGYTTTEAEEPASKEETSFEEPIREYTGLVEDPSKSLDIEHPPPPPVEPVSDESPTVSMDEIVQVPGSAEDDLALGEESRDFSSDFEIGTPEPYISEPPKPPDSEAGDLPLGETITEEETDDTPPVPTFEAPSEPEAVIEDEVVSASPEDTSESTGFTWTEYESALTPEESTPVEEAPAVPEEQASTPEELDKPEEPRVTVEESEEPEEPEEPPTVWSPYDESESIDEDMTDESEAEEDPKDDAVTPPPPPPPPESDESEEERRRRARRLFFGS